MYTKLFWLDALERSGKTVAQVLLTTITLAGVDVLGINWGQTVVTSLTAGVVSILTSIVSSGINKDSSASLVVKSSEVRG
jgi:hypothetical protein